MHNRLNQTNSVASKIIAFQCRKVKSNSILFMHISMWILWIPQASSGFWQSYHNPPRGERHGFNFSRDIFLHDSDSITGRNIHFRMDIRRWFWQWNKLGRSSQILKTKLSESLGYVEWLGINIGWCITKYCQDPNWLTAGRDPRWVRLDPSSPCNVDIWRPPIHTHW